MAWKGSYAYGSVPGDASSTHRYNWASRPELIRTGDLKQHGNSILSRYLTEEVSKEPLFEEADDTMASGTEQACLSGLGKMKSEDSWATLRENTLRARADCHSQEDIEAGRKVRARQSNGVTFQSRKTGKCQSVAKDLPGVNTSFSAYRQPEALPDKETNLAGCKAGISGLLFSSVCSSFAKINNAGQKRYSFGNFGCTSAPDVYLPTSATKVVRASADWDAKRPRHKSSKIRRATAGSFGATFANYSGKSFESRAQLTSRSICNQSSTPPSRKQTTPIVDPDMWCYRSLSLMTDATSFDCVVPSGKVHACGRNYTAPDSSENANRVAGTHLNRNSREHSCTTKRGEKPEKISDVLLDLGSESGCPVAEMSSIARSHQLQVKGKMAGGDAAASRKEEKTQEKRDVEALLKANQVDVSKSESRVWLWKVTPPVYKAWQSAFTKAEKDKDGGSLGSVFVTVDLLEGTKTVTGNIVQDPTMPREMIESLKQQAELDDKSSKSERNREITMELPAYGSKTTPDTYSLVHTDFPGPVYIFSETSEGKVVVDGLVYQKYDSKPSLNSFRKYTDPTKGSKIKECSGNEQNKPQMLNLTVPGNEKRTGHPLKNQQNKKVRMDPDKLQEVLFVLFEKQPRYTFTELVSQTAQPQDFLKKSLDQICVKVKEGGKTFYEIKPEYKGQGHN